MKDELLPEDAPAGIYDAAGQPRFFAEPAMDRFVAVVMNLDTVVLEPEAMKMTLVWRGTPPLRAIDDLDVGEVRIRLRYPS